MQESVRTRRHCALRRALEIAVFGAEPGKSKWVSRGKCPHLAQKMMISPQFEHVAATIQIYQMCVVILKSGGGYECKCSSYSLSNSLCAGRGGPYTRADQKDAFEVRLRKRAHCESRRTPGGRSQRAPSFQNVYFVHYLIGPYTI